MSLRFLGLLSDSVLPFIASDPGEIVQIETLAAAKLVAARVPQATRGLYGGTATVGSLTPLGELLMESLGRSDRDV